MDGGTGTKSEKNKQKMGSCGESNHMWHRKKQQVTYLICLCKWIAELGQMVKRKKKETKVGKLWRAMIMYGA